MTTVNVGSILTIDRGRYVGDAVNDKVTITNVTTATVPGYTFAWTVTLQNAFASTYRNGFVITRAINVVTGVTGQDAYGSPYYLIIAVDGTKKILTVVGDWTPTPPTSNFAANTGSAPPLLGNVTITTPSFPRFYQWFRDGVAIGRNADSGTYTVQNADVGKAITVKEYGSYWDGLNSPTTNPAAAGVTAASSSVDPLLVYSENLVYQGSFGLSDSQDGPLLYVSAASKSLCIETYNGSTTIYANGAEFTIPALVDLLANPSFDYSNLNIAQFARNQSTSPNRKFVEPTEGRVFEYGCQGAPGRLLIYGALQIPGDRLLMCGTNNYTYATNTGMWTRPVDLLTTGQVSQPFFVSDPRNGYINNPRWYSGYICNIPSTLVNGKNYQALLGGDLLSGVQTLSIDSNCSRGPSAVVWNSSDISTTLSAKSIAGTIASVQSTVSPVEYLLGLGSGVTFDPTGDYLSISGGSGRLQTVKITAWNSTSKVATVNRVDGGGVIFPSTNVTGVTLGNPVVLQVANAKDLYDSDDGIVGIGIAVKSVGGTTQLNNNSYYFVANGNSVALYSDSACTVPVNGGAFTPWTSGGTVDVIPTTTSTYRIVPKINGYQILGHTEYMQPVAVNTVSSVASGITGAIGHFIPNGTRSLIYVGTSCDGEYTYSPGAFGFTGNGPLVYDTGVQSAGPHSFPYKTRVWCYDLDELVTVKNGTRPTSPGFAAWDGANNDPTQLKPYAAFTITMPNPPNTQFVVNNIAYDEKTRRLYVMAAGGGPYGRVIINVYEVNNAVAV